MRLLLACLLIALGGLSPQQTAAPAGPYLALAWSPDGTTLAAGTDAGIWLFSPALTPITFWPDGTSSGESGGISALAWSPDGAMLAAARYDGLIRGWAVATGRRLFSLRGHIGAVNGLAFSPDGAVLASVGDDFSVRMWAISTQAGKFTPNGEIGKHTDRANALAFTPDGAILISGGAEGRLLRWEVGSGRARGSVGSSRGAVYALATRPDGAVLLSGGADQVGRVWQVSGGNRGELRGHAAALIAVGWMGETPITFSRDGQLIRWGDGGPRGGAAFFPARAAAFQGGKLAIAGEWGRLAVVDLATDQISAELGKDSP
jgi:WD40 repeat protein